MDITEEYINDSCLAVSKLIHALSSFEQEILNSLVRMTKTNKPQEQTKEVKNIYSQFVPREAIAGAILQIFFMCMRLFPKNGNKNETIFYLEDKIKDSTGKAYFYPIQYCVGRQISGIPIGLLIFAARNQYNHQDEPVEKLQYYNRIIFEALNYIVGEVGTTGLGFNLYSEKTMMFSYSVIVLLGWTFTVQTPDPILNFRNDIRSIIGISD